MQDFLYMLTSGESATLDVRGVLTTLLSAAVIGLVISLVYLFTHKKEGYSQAFCVALILLAPIVGMVILVIGNNVATAFSLAGAFALVRFRSAPGDPKDIAFVFLSVTMGLTCGLGYWIWAALATVVLCVIILVLHFVNFGEKKGDNYVLKITVPETLNYVGAFDECLNKYCNRFKLSRVKSVDFGALFELSFDISMKDSKQMREMLDDVRAMNGNLKIMLSTPENAVKSFHFQ
ncbi:MAG: DUF4956 domain-containing protein [Acetobacter sp.]|nr:DUF4956 domain-containing protein [Bacteroides sp.]MCM1340401.1 DUF4956 domain-containing protein [Acetobacter sp.]MCM1432952.1 DUF4956 domain-containing protein [Clostridiales bacterium]